MAYIIYIEITEMVVDLLIIYNTSDLLKPDSCKLSVLITFSHVKEKCAIFSA